MNIKIRNSTIISLVIGVFLLFLCYFMGQDNTDIGLNYIIFLFGSTLGWFVGTITSPYNDGEETKFKIYLRSASVFVSGYIVGKIDALMSKILSVDFLLSGPTSAFKSMLFLVSLLAALLITYIYRKYYETHLAEN